MLLLFTLGKATDIHVFNLIVWRIVFFLFPSGVLLTSVKDTRRHRGRVQSAEVLTAADLQTFPWIVEQFDLVPWKVVPLPLLLLALHLIYIKSLKLNSARPHPAEMFFGSDWFFGLSSIHANINALCALQIAVVADFPQTTLLHILVL